MQKVKLIDEAYSTFLHRNRKIKLARAHPDQANQMHLYYLRNKVDFEHWSSDFAWVLNFEFGWARLLKQRVRACDQKQALHWVILSPVEPQEIIGSINLIAMDPHHKVFNLGYAMDQQWRRQGIMNLALKRSLKEAFCLIPFQEIEASCQPENVASLRTLTGLGFVMREPPHHEKNLMIQGRLCKHHCLVFGSAGSLTES